MVSGPYDKADLRPAWKRTAGLADDGTILIPTAIGGDELELPQRAIQDGKEETSR